MHPDPLSKRLDGSTTIRCTLNLPRSADVRLHVPMTRNKEAGMHPSSYYDSSMTHHDDSSMTRKKEAGTHPSCSGMEGWVPVVFFLS